MDMEKREQLLRAAQDVYAAYKDAERELEIRRTQLANALHDVINAGDIDIFIRDRATLNSNAESVQKSNSTPKPHPEYYHERVNGYSV